MSRRESYEDDTNCAVEMVVTPSPSQHKKQGVALSPKKEVNAMDVSNGDRTAELIERRRQRQREVKRKSRAKQKSYFEKLQHEVKDLEAKYANLTAWNATNNTIRACGSDETSSEYVRLLRNYEHTRKEMESLHRSISRLKKRLEHYERFEATLLASINTFPTKMQVPKVAQATISEPNNKRQGNSSYEPLNTDECYEIIRQCYLEMFCPQFEGKGIRSGTQILGWVDERFVYGTNVRFQLSKCFPGVSAKELIDKSWDISSLEGRMRRIHPSTVSMKVLQVLSGDAYVLERRWIHHYYRNAMVRSCMLNFRFEADNAYTIAYRTLDAMQAKRHSTSGTQYDEAKAEDARKLMDLTMWFTFEDVSTATPDGDQDEFTSSEAAEKMACKVTYGGVLSHQSLQYSSFFMLEILAMLLRWDEVIGPPRLSFD